MTPGVNEWWMRSVMRRFRLKGGIHAGNSTARLRLLFEDQITASMLFEGLHSRQDSEDASEIAEWMSEVGFDVLGVRDSNGRTYGYIERQALTSGPCDRFAIPFHASDLISDSAPIPDVLMALQEKPRVFVLVGHEISGIVTRSDLQKPAIRLFLFTILTLLEEQLTKLIQKHFPHGSWEEHLNSTRLDAAKRIHHERTARGESVSLSDCLQFADKRDLVLKQAPIRESLGFSSKAEGTRLLKEAELLRNRLAHVQDLVSGTTWDHVIPVIYSLDMLLDDCREALTGSRY